VSVQKLKACKQCGSDVVRVHRTVAERLSASQVYECLKCGLRQSVGDWLWFDRKEYANCPSCGTLRISVRNQPDKIDTMYRSFRNTYKRLRGGALYGCRYCRLQFYDRRPLSDRTDHQRVPFRAGSQGHTGSQRKESLN
jgi:rubrerythrin